MIALVKSPLAEKYDLSSVKSFASGAASLSKELCDMLRDMHRIEVTDGYGMTESRYPPLTFSVSYYCLANAGGSLFTQAECGPSCQ